MASSARLGYLLLALALLGGCGGGQAIGASGGVRATASTPTTGTAGTAGAASAASPPRVPSGACAPGSRALCIMAADEGRTISVHVGETFTVELRVPHRSFGEPVQSGAKVLELLASSRSGAAAEAYYRAVAPGRVTLRAIERPLCEHGRACPQFLVLWQVEVLVRSARRPSPAG